MAPIRFRIRTIMIAVVVVAVVMAVFTAVTRSLPWMRLFRNAFSVSYMIFLYLISHPIIAFLAVALFISLVQFALFLDRFRSLRRRRPENGRAR